MAKLNITQSIFNKLMGAGKTETCEKPVKPTTPRVKIPSTNTSTSIYNDVMDTLEQQTKGGNNNGQQQQWFCFYKYR